MMRKVLGGQFIIECTVDLSLEDQTIRMCRERHGTRQAGKREGRGPRDVVDTLDCLLVLVEGPRALIADERQPRRQKDVTQRPAEPATVGEIARRAHAHVKCVLHPQRSVTVRIPG